MQQHIGSVGEHWVVEEAERRRLAQQNEREHLHKLQSRHQHSASYSGPISQPVSQSGVRNVPVDYKVPSSGGYSSASTSYPSRTYGENSMPASTGTQHSTAKQPYSSQNGGLHYASTPSLVSHHYPHSSGAPMYNPPTSSHYSSSQHIAPHTSSQDYPTSHYPRSSQPPTTPHTHVMEHPDRPVSDHSRISKPIPDSIKQSLVARATIPRTSPGPAPGGPSSAYHPGGPHEQFSHVPYHHEPVIHGRLNQPPGQEGRVSEAYQYLRPRPNTAYSQAHTLQPSSGSHYVQKTYPGNYANYGMYPGSTEEDEHAPPVPPKPPRLLSTGSDDSHVGEHVVSVSGNQSCAHCDQPLGKCSSVCLLHSAHSFIVN
jgi:hypothetical protein